MKLPAYPRTKPSGVEWLGDVPEDWELKRLKFVSREPIKNGVGAPSDTDDPELPRYVRITDIKSARELHSDTFRSLPKELADTARFTVRDILFACVGATFGKSYVHCSDIGPVCYAGYLAKYSPLRSVESRFISYWSESGPYWAQLNANVIQSTVQNFSAAKYRELALAIPRPAEQQAITAYLDRETGRLDRLVGRKRELIERLKEKRTALISRAVTRGLPPAAAKAAGLSENPPLKPSGLDWLGDIPGHWRVMALKWRSRCHSGDSISTEDVTPEATPERNIPVIGGNGLMGYCDSSNCDSPVLVIGRVGALCGNVHLVAPPAWVTDNALVMPTDPATFSREYLAAVLRTRNLNDLADKTAQPLITGTRVRNERVPVPPLPEQTAIAAYLDEGTAKLDALMEKVEVAVERLQEYRTALITAAVTGKIDVREAA